MKLNLKNRIVILDYIRFVAISCVILCHVSERMYPALVSSSNVTKVLYSVLFALGRLGVPFFLFLTGALVLNKSFKNASDVAVFYRRKLLPLIFASWVWTAIYLLLSMLSGVHYTLFKIIKVMLFLDECPLTHFWYLPMIIGLYIALPFVSFVVKGLPSKIFKLPLLLLVIVEFIIPFIQITSYVFTHSQISFDWLFDISFLGGCYGFYVLIGYFVFRKKWFCRCSSIFMLCITVSSFCITVFYSWISLECNLSYSLWYSNLSLMLCAVSIFVLCCKHKNIHRNKLIESFSKKSFAIYLVHMLFIDFFSIFLTSLKNTAFYFLFCIFFWTITLFFSYFFIIFVEKLFPKAAKILFNFR